MALAAIEPERAEPPLLRVRGLSASYGHVVALQDVDLDVWSGEVVGIAGDNGAGKSTLLRCLAGDLADARGEVRLAGEPITSRSSTDSRGRIGVVWQHLVLSDNLDAAANLMLGRERRGLLMPDVKFHARARAVLDDLGIAIPDTTRPVGTLTTGQRQLLAIARAVSPRPRLLLLDEPTAALNQAESAHAERLVWRIRDEGTTIVLVSHDVEQLLRLSHRVVVLRHGQVVAEVDPAHSHPDELLALMSGHDPSSAPRYQLNRLHSMADQLSAAGPLTSDDPAAGLNLILTTLGAALGTRRLCLHLVEDDVLRRAASVGLPQALDDAWAELPVATAPAPLRRAATEGIVGVDADVGHEPAGGHARLLADSGVGSWWAVPFVGSGGVSGVISVYRAEAGPPARDELELVNLYAAYAAGSVERDRLLGQLTTRNRLLETIRAVLQTLAGPDSLADALDTALHTLAGVTGADEVALYGAADGPRPTCRAFAGAPGATASPALEALAAAALCSGSTGGAAQVEPAGAHGSRLWVRLSEAEPATVLVATWREHRAGPDDRVLFEDAAHSILLALEREGAEQARRETSALLRSRELQHQFLARLSHELRTPLTAIRGYASSLMQADVDWDDESQGRFLTRISSESDRLRRLVDGLLDFSMIEAGVLRLRPDWVDLPLVIDAARSCLGPRATAVEVSCAPDLPVIWGDHDRLEQVLMNLMDNAVRHNPPGTQVRVAAVPNGRATVRIDVSDDGVGLFGAEGAPARAGTGLGLSITRGIVEAHRGTIRHEPTDHGTRFVIRLPVESDSLAGEGADA